MVIPKTQAEVGHCLEEKAWRKNNLYTIVTEGGIKVPFRQRQVQAEFDRRRHGLDVILKSRQHGFSTEVDIDMLDDCIFTPNLQCGIIAHTLNDAQEIFQTKVKLPYFEMPEFIRRRNPPLKSDGCTLRLANGSSIRVAVSFRSATTHRLHVSELGKICAKYPKRAEEIKTGTLPSVHPQLGGRVVIEGTAEGAAGDFYDLCSQAQADTVQAKKENRPLHALQYKFHFYAWYQDPKNAVSPLGITISDELKCYFEEIAEKGILTSPEQQAWYAVTKEGAGGLGSLMKREHPSTVQEAFEHSVTGAVYGEQMDEARADGRIGFYPWVKEQPVYTFWDLGYRNATATSFVQFIKEQVRIIDFYSETGRGAAYHAAQILAKPYAYGDHFMPHDVMNHEKGTGIVLKDYYDSLLWAENPIKRVRVVECPRLKADAIQLVRDGFNLLHLNDKTTGDLQKALSFYRYSWDEEQKKFSKEPVDDWAEDPCDTIQTLMLQYRFSTIGGKMLGYPHPIPANAYAGSSGYDHNALNFGRRKR